MRQTPSSGVWSRAVSVLLLVGCARADSDPAGGGVPSVSCASAGGAGAASDGAGGTGAWVTDGGGGQAPPPVCAISSNELDAEPFCAESLAPNGEIELVERWRFHAAIDGTQLFGVPLVANLDDDNGDGAIDLCDVPEVLIQSSLLLETGFLHRLLVLSGADGTLKGTIDADGRLSLAAPSIFDLDADGVPEVLATNDAGHLIALRSDGELVWESPVEVFDPEGWYEPSAPLDKKLRARFVTNSAITAADIDGDGSPEILVGMSVLAADGSLRFEDATRGAEYGNIYQFAPVRPVAADLDDDGQLEVLFGHVGYRADGSELFRLPLTTTPGYSHVADFLDVGEAQVLVQSSEGLTLISSAGEILWGPLGPNDGGPQPEGIPAPHPAAVVDLLGDGAPEVLINTNVASAPPSR